MSMFKFVEQLPGFDGTVEIIHVLHEHRVRYDVLADQSGLTGGRCTENQSAAQGMELLTDEANEFAESEARKRGIIK